jgi:DNA-binding Lrp family transcriptional regulator
MPLSIKLDRTDFALLEALQEDAGLSNKELARRVDLAPSSCLQRVRRLREAGILRGAHAEVAPAAMGIGLQALIEVRFAQHNEAQTTAFRDRLLARPEVLALYHVSGPTDYVVHVAVRDVPHLRDLGAEVFTNQRIVAHVETSLLFEHFRSAVLPNYSGGSGKTPARGVRDLLGEPKPRR